MARGLRVGGTRDQGEGRAEARAARQVGAMPAQPQFTSSPGRDFRAPESVSETIARVGQPLSAAVRKDMGRRLGYDFSRVRIHADSDAARSTGDLGAEAYTVGNDIAFASGRFRPETGEGQRLLAHELAHVVDAGDSASGASTVLPYRSPKSFNFGKGDSFFLREDSFNPAKDKETKPWIELITVTFDRIETDLNNNQMWLGEFAATYYPNAMAWPQFGWSVSGGGAKGSTKSDAGSFRVTDIKGVGYNSGTYSGTAGVDYDLADREGPNNQYSKVDDDGDIIANMSYAVFYNGGEALHVGPLYLRSKGCVHVDADAPEMMKRLNYHSVIGLTRVKVSYPKKP